MEEFIFTIDPGVEHGLVVKGKDKELCKIEVIDEAAEGSGRKVYANTYWKDHSGNVKFMKMFYNIICIVNGHTFKCVSSTATPGEAPYNTILELIEDVSGCEKTFYNGKCIVGCGTYDVVNHMNIYEEWKRLIDLVYGTDQKYKNNYSLYSEWHSFQNFAQWYEENKPTERSQFGSYMLVKDLDGFRDCELGPKNTLFVEKSILKFPKTYSYVLSNDSVYSMKTHYKSEPGKYAVYYYDHEQNRVKNLGIYSSQSEARETYVAFMNNKRCSITNYLKSQNRSMLSPLIDTFNKL